MFKKFCVFFILCASLLFTQPTFAKEVGGANIPDTMKAGNEELLLNGAGIRSKFWVSVYVGALYLKSKTLDAPKVLNADEAMAIKMHFVYGKGVDGQKLVDAWNEGFAAATNGNTASIQKEIDQFNSYFKGTANQNDIYDIVYVPNDGVTVSMNGTVKGNIKGLEFKKAVFGIWLSEKTALPDVKAAMLGQ